MQGFGLRGDTKSASDAIPTRGGSLSAHADGGKLPIDLAQVTHHERAVPAAPSHETAVGREKGGVRVLDGNVEKNLEQRIGATMFRGREAQGLALRGALPR